MTAIVTNDIRVYNALQFVESVSETANSSIYTFIGQPTNLYGANAAIDNVTLQYDVWDNMIAMKRINGSADIRSGIKKYVWASGNVYTAYSRDNTNLYLTQFYVINSDDNKVYKCIANNNGGASTVAPTESASTQVGNVLLSDGYKWKLMGEVSSGDLAKFGTPSFIPLTANSTVESSAVSGGILHIDVLSGGNYSGTPTVSIQGDGSGATATVNKSGTAIANITITNIGRNYRFANVVLVGGTPTTPANLKVSIAPPGGHGSNVLYELGGQYAILNSRIETSDTAFPTGITYYQVGLVKDPINRSTGSVSYASTMRAYKIVKLNTAITTVSQGNILTGVSTGANLYALTVPSADTTNVYVLQSRNLISNSNLSAVYANLALESLKKDDGGATLGTIQSVANAEVIPNTGRIIYVDNRSAITRATNQSESISIILEF